MRDERVRALLDPGAPVADAARARSWTVVRHAYAAREPVGVRAAAPPRRAAGAGGRATALLGTAAALRLAAGGARRGTGSRDRLEPAPVDRPRLVEQQQPRPVAPQPSLTLPAAGPPARADAARPLGRAAPTARAACSAATTTRRWSPRGLHVAVVRGRELLAVVPGTGAVRWTLTRPGRLALPRWAPGDGYRVAYLAQTSAGWRTRVVNGDGTGDRDLAAAACRRRAGVAAGDGRRLRPGPRAGRARRSPSRRSTRRERSGSSAACRRAPVALAWAADGSRLAVLLPGAVRGAGAGRAERLARRALPGRPAGARRARPSRAAGELLVAGRRPRQAAAAC